MITCSGGIVVEPQPRYNPPVFNSFFKGAIMLFCLKDGDAFPTEALGLPSRLGPAPVKMPADWFAQRDFERLCHAYPDGSFPTGEKQKQPPEFFMGNYWFPGEPPVPDSDDDAGWYGLFCFHRQRLTRSLYNQIWEENKLAGLPEGSLGNWYSLLTALRAAP